MYYVILKSDQTLEISKNKTNLVIYSGTKNETVAFKKAYEFAFPTKEDIDDICTYDIIRDLETNKKAWKYMGAQEQWVNVDPVTTEPISKKVEKVTLGRLSEILQCFAHEGYAMDEVEVFDDNGNLLSVPEKVEIRYDHKKEVVAIILKHKD